MKRFKIFEKVDENVAGSKLISIIDTQFNIWAFFFGLMYMLYRGLYSYAVMIFLAVLIMAATIQDDGALMLLNFALSLGFGFGMTALETYHYEHKGYKFVKTVTAQDYATALMVYKEEK